MGKLLCWMGSGHLAALAAVLLGLVAPLPAGRGQAPDATRPVLIAMPVSLSGEGESFGRPALEGARFALEEAQAEAPGLRVALEPHDDRGEDAEARRLAERIAAGPAVAVLGPVFSTASLAAGPVYAAAGLASLPPTATSDAITENATTFRVIFKNSDQGEILAHYIARVLGFRAAEVVVVQSGYGATLRDGFERTAIRLGLEARYHDLPRAAGEAALAGIADAIGAERGRAVILLTLDPEGARLLARLRRLGHPGPFLGGDAFGDEAFVRLLADEPEERRQPGFFTANLYGLAPVILDSANAETLAFARRFRARFGHEPVWQTVAGYDAARLALAAIRDAAAAAPGDPAAQRRRVQDYLLSLDSAERAQPGLLGPFWFDRARARQQAIRVGRFRNGRFESAPLQIVAVVNPDLEAIASGEVFETGAGRFGRLQRVVHTGVYVNEIQHVDVARSSFSADLYLWLRFTKEAGPGAADPTELVFPTQIGGQFDPARASERRERPDGTEYWLWRVQGDFRTDFDLRRFPFDRQTLALPFFNARAAADRIVYVIDRHEPREAAAAGATQDGAGTVSPEAFRKVGQWQFDGATTRRENLVTRSVLGDLDRTAAEGARELSGFVLAVDLHRRTLTTLAKTLIPLLVMTLITFASLFFPPALVKEKVTVAITGALSGAVLLAAINAQLGSVGYTVALEYVFYAFFVLALLCVVSVLWAERLRAAGRAGGAARVELATRGVYAAATIGVIGAIFAYAQ